MLDANGILSSSELVPVKKVLKCGGTYLCCKCGSGYFTAFKAFAVVWKKKRLIFKVKVKTFRRRQFLWLGVLAFIW